MFSFKKGLESEYLWNYVFFLVGNSHHFYCSQKSGSNESNKENKCIQSCIQSIPYSVSRYMLYDTWLSQVCPCYKYCCEVSEMHKLASLFSFCWSVRKVLDNQIWHFWREKSVQLSILDLWLKIWTPLGLQTQMFYFNTVSVSIVTSIFCSARFCVACSVWPDCNILWQKRGWCVVNISSY